MVRVLHLITGLNVGGAEMMLARLLETMDRGRFHSLVVSMIEPGPVGALIEGMGFEVVSLRMPKGVPSPGALWRLASVVRRFRPDVLQSWLYHADLLGCIAARVHGGSKLVWNVRCSNMDVSRYGIMTRLAIRACAALSSLPDKIVVNSHSGLRFHAALGYKAARCVVVPNGFDPERFKPDPDARRAVREALGAGPQARLVGVGARYDPMKGHAVFLRAAGSVARAVPEARFVLFGEGMDERNPELMHASRQEGVLNRLILLGRRSDVAEVMNALDLLVLPSIYGEGLPNIVGEAMACGVPCVVSDVGDAARLVGETGVVVPPGEADSLAEGVLALLARPAEELGALGRAARERIAQQYDLRGMGRQYEELYEQLARPV